MPGRHRMEKRRIMTALLMWAASSTVAVAQGEFVVNTNGSFEATAPGVVTDLQTGIDGWILSVGAAVEEAPEFEIVTEPIHHGANALRVQVHSLGPNAWNVEAAADNIPVTPGATYRYSIWARADEAGATVSFTVGNYAFNEYGRIGNAQITEEWQEYAFSFTINDNETYIRAPVHFNYAANVGNNVYIDHLQIQDPDASLRPIVVEAESGELGSDFEVRTDENGQLSYITSLTNFIDTSYPGLNRIATYEVTFPDSGWYNLFARVRMGTADPFNDDSFFYASGFGARDPVAPDDWIMANQLAQAGFTSPDQFVTGLGAAQGGVWKWVNLSENDLGEAPDSFYVGLDGITQIFQIGAREDGLDIDKLAFGRSDLYFTVQNLDQVTPGIDRLPNDDRPPGPPLAEGQDKWLGNIYSFPQLPDYLYYWNQVTPENASKWGSVEGARDVMNWGGLDAAYALAKDNGLPFRFHVLIWGNQQPNWMAALPENEQLEEIEEWFRAVAQRYPDIDYLEVVNEPLHDPPDDPEDGGYMEALGGTGETEWDWVITAFRMARDIFPPTTRLVLNEYNILSSLANASRYRGLIQLLQERDLIDVIGVQGHAFSTRGSAAGMRAVLDYLAETGLPIQVTEMDVDGNPNASAAVTDAMSDANQLSAMQRIFPALWSHPAVEGITMWGWRPGLWRQAQEAFLVREGGEERPALTWLREYLESYATATDEEDGLPGSFRLLGNYPNPFNPTTEILYEVVEAADVSIIVFDLLGRPVRTVASGHHAPGSYSVSFHADGLASGVYVYRLEAGSHAQSRRMVLIR